MKKLTKTDFLTLRNKGWTYEEIGISLGTSKQRIHQLFRKFEKERRYKIYKCVKCRKKFSYPTQHGRYINHNHPVCWDCRSIIDKSLWCNKHKLHSCKECGTKKIKHKGHGLCSICYDYERRNKNK